MTFEEMERTMEFLVESAAKHDAQIGQLIAAVNQDGEHIRGLVRLAELHHERLARLEGGEAE